MTRLLLILCLFLVACNQTQKNTSIQENNHDSSIDLLNEQLRPFITRAMDDSIIWSLNKTKDSIFSLNDPRLTFSWYLFKSQSQRNIHELDSAVSSIIAAEKMLHGPGFTKTDSLNFFTFYIAILINQQQIDSAIQIANEAYQFAKARDTMRLPTTSFDLAQLYKSINDLPNLKKYLFEAWEHKSVEPELTPVIALTIAYYYNAIDKKDSAEFYFKYFEKDTAEMKHPASLVTAYINTGIFLNENGRYKEGLVYQLKAKHLNDSLGLTVYPEDFIDLSTTYGRLGKFDKSLAYLDSSIELGKSNKDYNAVKLSWKSKADWYDSLGRYREALTAMDSAYAYYDVESDSSLRGLARELETKYNVRQKDDEIKNLAIVNAANLRIRQQQRIIIAAIVVAVVLFSAIAILLYRRRKLRMIVRETALKQQLLRTEMDPHFIFNSLSFLQASIDRGDSQKAVDYLTKISKLLRLSLENARYTFVPLVDEIEALQSYLGIQAANHENQFDYVFDLYDGYDEDIIMIPPMLIQPFVENAILHGFKNNAQKGVINIQIEKTNASIFCIIDDNGTGIKFTQKNRRSMSAIITEERLSIFGKQLKTKGSLTIVDKTKEGSDGVRVELVIPYTTSSQQMKYHNRYFPA